MQRKNEESGKVFFLELAAEAVKDVNKQRDKNGPSYSWKAMTRTGMALNLSGLWEEKQLFTDLQGIITKQRNHSDRQILD